jgi:MFS family permease
MLDLMATASDTTLNVGIYGFLTILLLIFGLFMILAGAFTAYFGSGKSRTIGVVLLVVGIVVGLLAGYWYHAMYVGSLHTLVLGAFLVLVAAAIGALIAVAIFLVAIMKS